MPKSKKPTKVSKKVSINETKLKNELKEANKFLKSKEQDLSLFTIQLQKQQEKIDSLLTFSASMEEDAIKYNNYNKELAQKIMGLESELNTYKQSIDKAQPGPSEIICEKYDGGRCRMAIGEDIRKAMKDYRRAKDTFLILTGSLTRYNFGGRFKPKGHLIKIPKYGDVSFIFDYRLIEEGEAIIEKEDIDNNVDVDRLQNWLSTNFEDMMTYINKEVLLD